MNQHVQDSHAVQQTKNLFSESMEAVSNYVVPVVALSSTSGTVHRCAPSTSCSSSVSATLKIDSNIGTDACKTPPVLTRIFHTDRDEETAKADGVRRVMKSDDGCMSKYCPRKTSSLGAASTLASQSSAVDEYEISGLSIQILTPFPGICHGVLGESMMKRAQVKGLVELEVLDLRDWAHDKHRTLDAPPYGGGPGMVMKIEPINAALQELRRSDSKVIFLSPQGKRFNQSIARSLAQERHLIFLCGHYEGVDQRVIDHLVDEEISIGDYVLTNGALAALVLTDAIVRLVPEVLGHQESALNDSFENGLLDFPHYTRPKTFKEWSVPPVLLSGNHAAIAAWRREQARKVTDEKRPDLMNLSH